MSKPLFTGVCTALVTPFENGKINLPMLEKLLTRQLEAGIKTVVISGTTGESATLSDDEKLTLFRHSKKFVGESMRIIAGTGSNSTEHAANLSKMAEQCGVDGLLVVSPYYIKATPSGLIGHYETIANAVRIPIILYNVPSRTGLDIPTKVYQALSAIPNIVGVKEASADICKISKIRKVCPDDFTIWSGNDEMITPTMALGGAGVISVVSNVAPARTLHLTRAALAGDYHTAAKLQLELLPLIEALFSEVNPIPVKEAMKQIGFDCGPCRLPLTQMSESNLQKLTKALPR